MKPGDLIKLLQDELVRKEIRKICLETQNVESKSVSLPISSTRELAEMERQLAQQSTEIDRLNKISLSQKEQLSDCKERLDQAEEAARLYEKKYMESVEQMSLQKAASDRSASDFQFQIKELRQINEQYAKTYSVPQKYYELFLRLSSETKDGLCNVVCDSDVIHFICSLSNVESLKRIWEYTKNMLSDPYYASDTESLKEIFFYFFALYNDSLPEPLFRLDDTVPGDEYEDSLHAKARGSASSGIIREVLLPGYVSVNTGKPICKTVVYV